MLRLDSNQVFGTLLDVGWRSAVARLVSRSVSVITAIILSTLFGGPVVAWVVFIGTLFVEFIFVHKANRGFMMNRVREKIGNQFRGLFNKNGPEFQRVIRTKLEEQFTEPAVKLKVTLDREIAAVQQELDTAAEKRREGQVAIAEEIVRSETINSLLTAQFEELSRAAYGRVLTPEEQRERVDRFLFTEDEDDA